MKTPDIKYGFNSPSDLMSKLRRDANILDIEATPDAIFNFTITAHHLLEDWIRQRPKTEINSKVKKEISKKLSRINGSNAVSVCRDIATGSKHFKLDNKYSQKRVIESITVYNAGYGNSRFGKSPYGRTEHMVDVETSDNIYNIHDLKKEVMEFCEYLFEKYEIP